MNLPHDLKDFHSENDDPFQLISPDLALVLFLAAGFLGYVLGRFA